MKNKKILLPIILAAVFVIAGISVASAWLFAGAQKNNELTAGDQSIVISESNFTVEPNDVLDNPVVNKNPVITNNGNTPCYMRAYVGCNSFNIEARPFVNDDVWEFSDGYYYCKKLLNKGDSVTFFNQIELAFDGQNITDSFDVFIYAESVESDGSIGYSEAWSQVGG